MRCGSWPLVTHASHFSNPHTTRTRHSSNDMPTPSPKRRRGPSSSRLHLLPVLLLALLVLVHVCPARAQDATLGQLAGETEEAMAVMREEESSERTRIATTSAQEVCPIACPSCLSFFPPWSLRHVLNVRLQFIVSPCCGRCPLPSLVHLPRRPLSKL